ncbi:hypothetical protein [Tepidimonas charontis]|uniref:Uncharacterized protein n=1 Tax=Tepidimonas charontis TaxID=2267262 RepID=A0A554XFX0_9BURK|nr:hypothetical protein [Tepidimonas charontis]TSE34714.1 hypothetical protein Tchar_01218 [Tepidimonas charontis]
MGVQQRIINVLIALDQLAWVLLTLGRGHPDETISAAAWRMEQQGKIAGRVFRPLVDLLFRPIEKDHCYKAWLSEVQRAQLPSVYRG